MSEQAVVISRQFEEVSGDVSETLYEVHRYDLGLYNANDIAFGLIRKAVELVSDSDQVVTVQFVLSAGPEDAMEIVDHQGGIAAYIGVRAGSAERARVREAEWKQAGVIEELAPREFWLVTAMGEYISLNLVMSAVLAEVLDVFTAQREAVSLHIEVLVLEHD